MQNKYLNCPKTISMLNCLSSLYEVVFVNFFILTIFLESLLEQVSGSCLICVKKRTKNAQEWLILNILKCTGQMPLSKFWDYQNFLYGTIVSNSYNFSFRGGNFYLSLNSIKQCPSNLYYESLWDKNEEGKEIVGSMWLM